MTERLPPRERILDAAWKLIEERGFVAATTKNIAAAASVSEGAIYNHFADKAGLVLALVQERIADFRPIFATLGRSAGKGDSRGNLAAALAHLIGFYEKLQLVSAGLFADRAILEAMHALLKETDKGPLRAHEALAGFLQSEISAGRLPQGPPVPVLTALLIGAVQERGFSNVLTGRSMKPAEKSEFAASIVSALFGRSPEQP